VTLIGAGVACQTTVTALGYQAVGSHGCDWFPQEQVAESVLPSAGAANPSNKATVIASTASIVRARFTANVSPRPWRALEAPPPLPSPRCPIDRPSAYAGRLRAPRPGLAARGYGERATTKVPVPINFPYRAAPRDPKPGQMYQW
jgi:hypothetical protein